ncbi:MAG: hypothetical protein EHM88_18690 [Candidatus Rokuibacteriota bacterium]|nr:MAG: hypothetical protein EHM88_18690 [Candidatus Rokubacteria bacterium]
MLTEGVLELARRDDPLGNEEVAEAFAGAPRPAARNRRRLGPRHRRRRAGGPDRGDRSARPAGTVG